MAIKETNRLRLARLTARYAARRAATADGDARSAFERDFMAVRDDVLVPLLEELGGELQRAGHGYAIDIDGDPRRPSLVFRVLLAGAAAGKRNEIGFFVRHDAPNGKSEAIAFLHLLNEFELARFWAISEMRHDALEQLVVDALEHMLACNQ